MLNKSSTLLLQLTLRGAPKPPTPAVALLLLSGCGGRPVLGAGGATGTGSTYIDPSLPAATWPLSTPAPSVAVALGYGEWSVHGIPATTTQPGQVLLYDDAGGFVFLTPGLAPGSYALDEVTAGRFDSDRWWSPSPAGDVDADGWGDLWLGTYLLHGPVDASLGPDDAAATLEGCGHEAVGGFDADGDGQLDVGLLATASYVPYQADPAYADVFFGPFDGTHVGAACGQPVLPQHARLTGHDGQGYRVSLVPDGIAPGADGLVLSVGSVYDVPSGGDAMWPATLARGQSLGLEEAAVEFSREALYVGDIDGDQLADWRQGNQVVYGPVEGQTDAWTQYLFPIGDVDGDGSDETLAWLEDDAMLLWGGSRITDPSILGDQPTLLLYEASEGSAQGIGTVWPIGLDADGDGLVDLVAVEQTPTPGDVRHLFIWYASDLP